jgi:5-methyltetrahydrofolate--homocysteine methyltransferase
MQTGLLERLKGGILLLDGAMGTMLQKAGLKSGHEIGELWNLDHNRDKVLQIHIANVRAGSNVIISNTFGANRIKLEHYGAADRLARINIEGARIAREAAQGGTFVAGDIGPSGEILEQWGGTISADKLRGVYEEQAAALAEGGVDLFALETFMDLEEIKIALEAVKKVCDLPVLASMTFQASPAGMRTMWGLTPQDTARGLAAAGAEIIGANCGLGIREMIKVVSGLAEGTDRPVAAQPNAGAPEMVDGATVYRETAEQMAGFTPELAAAGARLIGGCCGTTPEYIAAAKRNLGL